MSTDKHALREHAAPGPRRSRSAAERESSRNIEAARRPTDHHKSSPPLPQVAAVAQRAEGNRTGLPDALKNGVEQLSGVSLDHIRVHRNSSKPAQLNAHAFAQGSDIHLGPGQEKHLAHEAWHAAQQAQGRVRPTGQAQGVALNDDAALEREADVMGQKALQTKVARGTATTQRKRDSEVAQLGKKKTASQEQGWKDEIIKHGFTDSQVKIGGMGTANADIEAHDGERLWLFEAKGQNQWLSKDNVEHTGNVPAKQLSQKLFSRLATNIRTTPLGAEHAKDVSVGEALSDPDTYPEARNQILLGASNTDLDDALLGLQYDTVNDTFDRSKGAAIPLSLHDVINYIAGAKEGITIKKELEDFVYSHGSVLHNLNKDLSTWNGDARSFFVRYPQHLIDLENAYTALRKTSYRQPHRGGELDKLHDDIAFRFVPVVSGLTHVQKPVQEKKAASGAARAPAQRKSEPVAQRVKFKNSGEAEAYLRQHLQAAAPVGDEWTHFHALLQNTPYGIEPDINSNINALIQAYARIQEQMDIGDMIAMRGAQKQRTVSASVWTHIVSGEVSGKNVTGYHWTGLGEQSAVEAFGAISNEDQFGCYKQSVRERAPSKKVGDRAVKKDKSSFYPDHWTEAEVRMAVEYAVQEGHDPVLTVTLPAKGHGLVLFNNGKSIFPYL